MSTRTLTILLLVTAAVLAGGVMAWSKRNTSVPLAEESMLYPGLQDRVNAAAAIVVTARQGPFEVRKLQEGRWGLADRGGYPVQFEKVREALVGLSQLRLLEAKTSKPENYGRIGVGDPATDEKAVAIAVRDDTGQLLADVVLGDRTWEGQQQQRYVRRTNESESWLAEGRIEVAETPMSWVDQNILRLGRDRIRSISVIHPDGERLSVSRPDKAARDFSVADLPADRELSSVGAANVLGSAFSFVRMEDVSAEGPEAPMPTDVITVTVATFEGLTVEIRLGAVEGRTWARMAASFLAPPTPAEPDREPEGTSEEPAEPEAPAEPAEQAEARDLQQKFAGWVFEFSEPTAEKFRKRLADLTKAKASAAPTDGGLAEPGLAEPGLAEPGLVEPGSAEPDSPVPAPPAAPEPEQPQAAPPEPATEEPTSTDPAAPPRGS